jgi:hypothetical protein
MHSAGNPNGIPSQSPEAVNKLLFHSVLPEVIVYRQGRRQKKSLRAIASSRARLRRLMRIVTALTVIFSFRSFPVPFS